MTTDVLGNSFDANGLVVATQAQVLAYLKAQFIGIYGQDVNLASNTPDGQWLNVMTQVVLDLEDLLVEIYSSMDPDNAVGVTLDQRLAINGVQREAGTYTVTPVTLVTTASVNLYGLDQATFLNGVQTSGQPVYTVADAAGNQWQLQTTHLGLASGTNVLNFQAATPGAVLTVPNTITVPVSVVLGVSSINNPTTYVSLGVNEESDALVKIRRQQSVANGGQGWLASLRGALLNVTGVTYANVVENKTDTTDANGVTPHTIWAIVGGSGAAAAIANAIYTKRNAACNMKGSQTQAITQVDGSTFTVQWDNVTSQNLFIAFTVTSINGITAPNIAAIRSGLVTGLAITNPTNSGQAQEVNINQVATAVQATDANTLVTSTGLSLALTQTAALSGVAASGSFQLSYAGATSAAINWNDSIGTIQTKAQAVTGLSGVTVTGSIASQSLVFNLAAVPNGVQGLITVVANTLQTSAPAAITFAWNEGYQNVLSPSSLANQLVVSAANIVILPMQLTPAVATVAHTASATFTGLGGYGTLTYSFQTNNSGGTVNASTGAYTAGSSSGVTDTLKVTDAFGNTATASVTVT